MFGQEAAVFYVFLCVLRFLRLTYEILLKSISKRVEIVKKNELVHPTGRWNVVMLYEEYSHKIAQIFIF